MNVHVAVSQAAQQHRQLCDAFRQHGVAVDAPGALRHQFRHHTQKARRLRTGPDLLLQMVAGVGFEPTTFGL